jgi:hypothetical protein
MNNNHQPAKVFVRRMEALNRRADFLSQRIDNYVGKNASRDKAELSALKWAINLIEDNPALALMQIRLEPPKEAVNE